MSVSDCLYLCIALQYHLYYCSSSIDELSANNHHWRPLACVSYELFNNKPFLQVAHLCCVLGPIDVVHSCIMSTLTPIHQCTAYGLNIKVAAVALRQPEAQPTIVVPVETGVKFGMLRFDPYIHI